MRLKIDHEFIDVIDDKPHDLNGKPATMKRVAMISLQAGGQGEGDKRKRSKLIKRLKGANGEISLGVDEANLIRESIIAVMAPTIVDDACDLIDEKQPEEAPKE